MNSSLKSKLRANKLTVGSWITLGYPAIAEILARAGFDWLVVDLEHSTISIEQAGDLIRVIDLCGVAPLVRLTSNDPDQIKRVMDAGAAGIVVPMVNTVADAERAVSATRYPPRGMRGVGLARSHAYGSSFSEYLEWQQEGPIVVVQIEHQEAVGALEAILSVPGVDGFIIGPYDLSCSMGIPGEFDRPEFQRVMKRILTAGLAKGCPAGIHVVEPSEGVIRERVAEGYRFIAYSVDIRLLDVGARCGVAAARGAGD